MKHSSLKRFLALLLCTLLLCSMFTSAWADPDDAEPEDPDNSGTLTLVEPAGEREPAADEPLDDSDDDELPISAYTYLWLGETAVNADNASDPLGNGQASFDPSTDTLTFTVKSPSITGLHDGVLIDAPGLETLNIVTPAGGLSISNDTAARIISVPDGSLSVDGNLSITFESPDRELAVFVENGMTVNGSLSVDTFGYDDNAYTGTAVMCNHGPVTVNGDLFCASEVGVMCADGDISVGGNADFFADAWGSKTYCLRALNGHGIEVGGRLFFSGNMNYVAYAEGDITVHGVVSITNGNSIGGHGIYSVNGNVVCESTVTISVKDIYLYAGGEGGIRVGGTATLTGSRAVENPWILGAPNGPITVNGNLTISGGGLDQVYAKDDITVFGDASIKNSLVATTVKPYDGRAMTSAEGSVSITGSLTSSSSNSGVYAGKDITIGGDATVGVSIRNERDYILKAETGELNIGGSLTTTGLAPSSAFGAAGITVGKNVTITNAAEDAVGLRSDGKVTMLSGEWDITAKQAILAGDGIEIPETHSIVLPVGGVVSQLDGGFTVTEQDGTTIPDHVIISDAEFITITFDFNYVGSTPVQMMIRKGGAVGTLPNVWSHGEAPDIWHLAGWYTERAEGVNVGKVGDKVTVKTTFDQDTTVYAHWFLPGDVNGDGAVDNRDVTRLIRFIHYKDVDAVEYFLDFDWNGDVDNQDVIQLIRFVLYQDVEIY